MGGQFCIVTGADWSHAASLLQLLASIRRFEPGAAVTIYDLGMTAQQRLQVAAYVEPRRLKTFDFSAFPPYFDISVNAGEYAWKPTIIAAELAFSNAPLCWMDAGNILLRPLHHLKNELRWRGFFALPSSGTIKDWTHPLMLSYLGLPPDWGAELLNLSAACVGFSPGYRRARTLAFDWARLAAVKDCIAPDGSSRDNHRQDQALLTVLAYRSGVIQRPSGHGFFQRQEFAIHRDILPEADLLIGREVPKSMAHLLPKAR